MKHGLAPYVSIVVTELLSATRLVVAIIRGIVNEQKDQAIAYELGISYNTLRMQLSRLYRKLGVQTRVGVAVAAFTELITIRQKEVDARQKSGEEV